MTARDPAAVVREGLTRMGAKVQFKDDPILFNAAMEALAALAVLEQQRDDALMSATTEGLARASAEARAVRAEEALRRIAEADGYREPATMLVSIAREALAAAGADMETTA